VLKRIVKKSLNAARQAVGMVDGLVNGPPGPGYKVPEFSEFERIRAEARAQDRQEGNAADSGEEMEAIQDGTHEISAEDLRVMLEIEDADDGPVLLDVREDFEWKAGHLPGAQHIPLGQLDERAIEVDRNRPVVVYCASGIRSIDGSYVLKRQGFPRVSSLAGGISGWQEAGNAVDLPG
jgi:rhodanese-related sulfurtransferase